MWCTNCQTAFDWNTGEIVVSGPFHNPHYVEWQRKNGSATVIGNDNCNGYEYISPYQLERTLRCDESGKRFMIEFLRCLYHIYDIELNEFRRNRRVNEHEKYLRLRIEYIENKMTKEEFKNKLQQQEKKENKRTEVCMVYDMLYNTGRTIINEILLKDRKIRVIIPNEEVQPVIRQITDLIEYTNSSMSKIGTKYKNKVPNISIRDNRFIIQNI